MRKPHRNETSAESQLPADRDLAVPQKARIYQGEDYVLEQLEGHAERFPQALSFRSLAQTLDRALSEDSRQEYEALHFAFKQKGDLTLLRLANIGDSLLLLESSFRSKIPSHFDAITRRILDHRDRIQQIFADFRAARIDGQLNGTEAIAIALSALTALQRIDRHTFPDDLVDISSDERRHYLESRPRFRARE